MVDGDATRLEQVFVNLLTNAAKYTPTGGRISLTAAAEGGDFIFRVRDTGEGIAAEMLPRMFEMFTQVETSTRPLPRGARHRADAREGPGRAPRRDRHRDERGARQGERVRRPAPRRRTVMRLNERDDFAGDNSSSMAEIARGMRLGMAIMFAIDLTR